MEFFSYIFSDLQASFEPIIGKIWAFETVKETAINAYWVVRMSNDFECVYTINDT